MATLVGLVASLPPAPAAADARSEQAEVRRKKAEAAARLDVLKASDQEVERALDALDSSLVDTVDLVGESVAAERRAVLAEEAAVRQLAEGEERLRVAVEGLRGQAVHAYTQPLTSIELSPNATPGDISRSLVYVEVRAGQSADKLDEVKAARADLATARRRARSSKDEAARQRAASERRLSDLEGLQAKQMSVIEALEAKIAVGEDEVDHLAATDAELGAAISRQDAEAAARRRAELLALQAAAAERARQAAPPTTAAAPTRAGIVPGILPSGPPRPVTSTPAGPGLTTVRGITVASSIAGQLAGLLAASDRAGLSLSGGGYRSPEAQIAVRRANCGPTQYDIYEKPASQCSPPTAKPGSSMHERGLAIDFANRGSAISSRSNPAFVWLAGNAGRFGFRNLPSEPWHWSTNGN
jgi:uncharacterized coiled-coil protein SlyX